MACGAVWWLLVVASASATDLYNGLPPLDFDDYETNNDIDTDPYWMGPRYHDLEDWKRDIIFFKLAKAMQNNPEEFYRSEYGVDADPSPNAYSTMDVKPQFVKRSSKAKEKPKSKSTKPRPSTSQPKWKVKNGKVQLCYFKICAYRLPS